MPKHGDPISYDDLTVQTLKDKSTGVTLGKIVASGSFTTAGGDATESIPVSGAINGDFAVVYVSSPGATPVTVSGYDVSDGSIGVSLSGDPSTDHTLKYVVFRSA